MTKSILFMLFTLLISTKVNAKSIVFANYYNVILYYPAEYGGNDDIRVVFDVRNVTGGTFKYLPIVVDVAYDAVQNIVYGYLESAVKSHLILIRWFGGKWCYQIMFEFDSSTYSNYMYHSLVTLDNFVYWTSDRYVMSGRIPGYEMRRLMQPGWERIYRMSIDKPNKQLYVASFDFGENVIYSCSILRYSCIKLITTSFSINSIYYDSQMSQLYVGSVQMPTLYRYADSTKTLLPVSNVRTSISDMAILNDNFGVFTSRETISICKDIRLQNCIRLANPRLVDPYTLQYVFSFDHINDFSNYPYPYSQFQDILWKDKQYLFHLHILGMDYVENDNAFLPQMDLNNNFLRVESCVNIYFDTQAKIIIPSLIAGGAVLFVILISIMVCICKSKKCGCFNKKSKGKIPVFKNPNTAPSIMSNGSQVPFHNSSNIDEESIKSVKKKMPTANMKQTSYTIPSSSQLNYNSIGDNRVHSSGIYIMGNNHNVMPLNYTDSDISNGTDSYLNPKYSNRLTSKPIKRDNYRPMNPLPLSIDSKKSYYSDESIGVNNYQFNQLLHNQSKNQKFVTSCHIPIYGSTTNGQNFINIKKAFDYQNDKNLPFNYNFLNDDDEKDSYDMLPM